MITPLKQEKAGREAGRPMMVSSCVPVRGYTVRPAHACIACARIPAGLMKIRTAWA